jgi:nicotinamidase-related amidase
VRSTNLRKLIPAVRSAGIRVFIVPHHRSDPQGRDYDNWQHINVFQEQNKPLRAFEVGSWGGEFNPEFGPQKGDVVIRNIGRRAALQTPISTCSSSSAGSRRSS